MPTKFIMAKGKVTPVVTRSFQHHTVFLASQKGLSRLSKSLPFIIKNKIVSHSVSSDTVPNTIGSSKQGLVRPMRYLVPHVMNQTDESQIVLSRRYKMHNPTYFFTILLYTAVLRPIMTYGSPVWGYAVGANIKILEVAQNSLIRNIVKANRYAKNSKIYDDIKILPFKAYIQKLAISFYNKLPNNDNENVKMLSNYYPEPDTKRPRRIVLDSYNLPNN
ncbi:RNA-directed DNA polymerase from mobile element jockey [Trichonephila clavipes]|nr:RNA-directed DNA polymerase from mobile element jockey [Trichonephila clavipes]